MDSHPEVPHPRDALDEAEACRRWLVRANDRLLTWMTEHVLGSALAFDVALVVPLLLWNAPNGVKLMLALFSGSWLQWWALHALQRYQARLQKQSDAKADADHRALTHIATQVDRIASQVATPTVGDDPTRPLGQERSGGAQSE